MNVTASELRLALGSRYPGARLFLLDATYVVPKRSLLEDAYNSFMSWMWGMNLVKWVSNKLDCDKWAWLFKAHVTIRNALGSKADALPVGLLCYSINGDPTQGHAINCAVYADAAGNLVVTEIEPQPRNGLTELNTIERTTVWLVIM